MKEYQNSRLNTSEDSPNFLGMSLLAILRQGSGLLLKEAIDAEITEHLGRLRYQHGEEFRGHRNGAQKTNIDTPIGPITYERPKVAYADSFQSRYHTPHVRRPEEFAAAVVAAIFFCPSARVTGFVSLARYPS
jgi:transposase-like protein